MPGLRRVSGAILTVRKGNAGALQFAQKSTGSRILLVYQRSEDQLDTADRSHMEPILGLVDVDLISQPAMPLHPGHGESLPSQNQEKRSDD